MFMSCNCPTNTGGVKMHNLGCFAGHPAPLDTFAPTYHPTLLVTLRFTDGDELIVGAPAESLTDDGLEHLIVELTRRFLRAARADYRVTTL